MPKKSATWSAKALQAVRGDKNFRLVSGKDGISARVRRFQPSGNLGVSVRIADSTKPSGMRWEQVLLVTDPTAIDDARAAAIRTQCIAHVASAKAVKEAGDDATLYDVALDWHKSVAVSANHRSANDSLNLIEWYLGRSKFRNHPIKKMDKPEFNALFEEVYEGALERAKSHGKINEHTGKAIANRIHALCLRITKWYASTRARTGTYESPITGSMLIDKRSLKDRSRDRVLSAVEIKILMQQPAWIFADIAKVCLLTLQRREKVATMKWKDLKGNQWTIDTMSGEKSNASTVGLKDGKRRPVVLPKLVMSIINRQSKIPGNPFVFAGKRPGQPFTSWSASKMTLDHKLAIAVSKLQPGKNDPAFSEPFVIHDLRRSGRSILADERLGVSYACAETIMGHSLGTAVAQIYIHTDWTEPMGKALQALSDEVERIMACSIEELEQTELEHLKEVA